MAEAQRHGALRVLMVEVAVEEEEGRSSVFVAEGRTMLMRVQIDNNDDCITRWPKFHVDSVITFITRMAFY